MSRHMMATRMPQTHESCASLRLCTIGLGAWLSISLPQQGSSYQRSI